MRYIKNVVSVVSITLFFQAEITDWAEPGDVNTVLRVSAAWRSQSPQQCRARRRRGR